MIIRNLNKIKSDIVREPGSKEASIKRMIDTPDGADRFVLSVFKLMPSGATPPHFHDWEHEIYILKGSMQLVLPEEDRTVRVNADDVIFIPRGEQHGFRTGADQECDFIVVAPTERPPSKNVYLSDKEYQFTSELS